MNDKEFSGYKGEALEAIKKAEVEIGDMICVTRLCVRRNSDSPLRIRRRQARRHQTEKRLQHRHTHNTKHKNTENRQRNKTSLCFSSTPRTESTAAESRHNKHRRNHSQPRGLPNRRRKSSPNSKRSIRRRARTSQHSAHRRANIA